jgi:hypothetical protein
MMTYVVPVVVMIVAGSPMFDSIGPRMPLPGCLSPRYGVAMMLVVAVMVSVLFGRSGEAGSHRPKGDADSQNVSFHKSSSNSAPS